MSKSLDIIDPKKEIRKEPEEPILNHEEKTSGGVFYLVIGIIAIIIAAIAAVYILYFDNSDNSQTSESGALVSETAIQSTTVIPETSQEPSTTPVGETTQTEQTTAFKYSDENIRIVNGNGISGEASRIKSLLEELGYEISSVGNASRSYNESIIYYKTSQDDLAQALKDALIDQYSASTQNADNIVGSYDAVVVLGSK